jgi:predicted Zn-dependent protease
MLDERLRDILMTVRDRAAAKGVTATLALHRENSHLMRIGNSSVSLNTSETLTRLDVAVVDGRREGSHTHLGALGGVSDVQAALDLAVAKAALAAEKDYPPPITVVEESVNENAQYDAVLAALDPAVKAEAYARVFREVGPDYNYSGAWSSGVTEQYLVSTANRLDAWHIGTDQRFNVVLKHPERRWEISHTQTGWRAADVASERAVAELRSLLPVYEASSGVRIDPGAYTVLLGAETLAEIVSMALWTGFSGRGWEEKWGWTAHNQIGDVVLGRNIALVDDPADARTFGFGFDLAGKRRRRFPLVEDGALVGLMYDASAAAKHGRQPTGHDTASPSIVMRTGDGPTDALEAVRGHDRVLSIPALHYVHVPNPSEGAFTGSSRFNAALVEDGRVVRPLFSSRISDTFQNVLGHVTVIAQDSVSIDTSNTYGRRAPNAMSLPAYVVCEGVKITDCADAF